MRQRFGDSEQTIIARIQHRKQREDESVQAYAEDMNMMFAQCQFPEVLKRNLLIDNLKPNLRKQVVSSIPTTIEQVITNAIFLEETAVGVTSEKIKGWEQQRSHSKTDAIDRITKSMDKMTIALSHNFSRQDDQHPVPLNRPPAPPRPQRDPGNGPMQCWKCQGYGHKAIDCNNAPRATNYARANLLESHVHDQYNRGSDHDDYTPSTIEAQIYAAGGRTGPMQRAPKHRTSWTPEGIQAIRDARANRGNAAASGSGAAPAPVGAPRRAEPGPTPPVVDPPAGRYNTCESRRSAVGRAIDVIAHLEHTPMKITYGTFFKEAPDCCEDLIKELQKYLKPSNRATEARAPPAPKVSIPANEPLHTPRPFNIPRSIPDTGPIPMETAFETEEYYHAEAHQVNSVNAVVRADVDVQDL